jgi:serine/threonine protein kinase
MEKCQPLSSFSEGDELGLFENMGTLHRFKIMHMDINPDNMMFSQTFGKTVFIDFGLSEVIEENCG